MEASWNREGLSSLLTERLRPELDDTASGVILILLSVCQVTYQLYYALICSPDT